MQKISIPLIAGLASGFVFLNLVLGLIWFLCRRSNMRRAQRRQQELEAKRDMERSVSFFKKNTAVVAPVDIEAPEEKDSDGEDEDELAHWHSEKPDRYTPPPIQANRRRQSEKGLVPPPSLAALARDHLTAPSSFKLTATSGDSICESASMYSTASAPIHLHEQILLSPAPVRNTNERLLTPVRPAGRHPFRATEGKLGAPLPSPIRPLLLESPTGGAFGGEIPVRAEDNPTPPHQWIGERTSEVLHWLPSKRASSPSSSRPASEWYYAPKRSSVNLPPHLRLAPVEPLRIAKSSPIGRQPALNH